MAPGRSAVWPGSPPECLKTLGFLSVRANLTCKLRVKMDVGSLGGAGAVRGVAWQPSRMLKNARVSEREGQSDLQIASENGCWLSWRQVGGKADEAALACP